MRKDTVYVDVEDDITDIVGKVTDSDEKIIALVPPKRSNVLSSVVNLKLINKAAHDASKKVVLITTDKTMISLAGGIGMYVAPNQQSAPAIPAVEPSPESMPSEIIRESETAAGSKKFSLKRKGDNGGKAAVGPVESGERASGKLPAVLRVPNFDLFKKRLVLIILGVAALIGGSIWAFYLAPSAHIFIEGQTTRIATDSKFIADTAVEEAKFDTKELPATSQELKKELSEPAAPTGQKNIGQKAKGTMTLTNCINDGQQHVVPAGTTFSSGDLKFASDKAVTLPPALYSGQSCKSADFGQSKDVGVTAVEAGDQYNLSGRTYTSSISGIRASGSAMSGGTTEVVTVLSQVDVDKATEAALTKMREGAKDALFQQFASDIYVIDPSFARVVNEAAPSVPVGERADSASVKVTVTFFALGVKKDIMTDFLKSLQSSSLQPNQAIFNTGLDNANLTILEAPAPSRQVFQIKTDAFAGPAVDLEQARKELAGKSFGEAKKWLESMPGVTKADIRLSPFWVFSMPRQADHIHLEIKVN